VIRREPQVNFRSAQAARLDGVPDAAVLASAAADGRILVSHDFQTMPRHFRQFVQSQRSPGVLLIRQDLPVGVAVESLLLIWETSEPNDWENRLCLLPSLVTIAMSLPEQSLPITGAG
jgi:hypothetical protein